MSKLNQNKMALRNYNIDWVPVASHIIQFQHISDEYCEHAGEKQMT